MSSAYIKTNKKNTPTNAKINKLEAKIEKQLKSCFNLQFLP